MVMGTRSRFLHHFLSAASFHRVGAKARRTVVVFKWLLKGGAFSPWSAFLEQPFPFSFQTATSLKKPSSEVEIPNSALVILSPFPSVVLVVYLSLTQF